MVWTAIRIVQSALIQGKSVTPTTVKALVTVDELVRTHHMNELNKSTSSTVDDIKPPSVSALTNSTWKNWYQQIVGYFKAHPNSTKETSLYYVIREPLSPEQMGRLSDQERRAYDFTQDPASYSYLTDRSRVWGILQHLLSGQGAYAHIKEYEHSRDATSAMSALRKAYEGSSMKNARLREAYDVIANLSYEGNERSFPFSRFIETLLINYQIIEDYDTRMSDRNKISQMIKKINVRSTAMDMAIHNIQEEMDKGDDVRFDNMWPWIQNAIAGSDTKGKKTSNVSQTGTHHDKRGKGRGSSTDGSRTRVRFDRKKVENGVDYTDVNTQFTEKQWLTLSPKTRVWITKRRHALNKKREKHDGAHDGKKRERRNVSQVKVVPQDYINQAIEKTVAALTSNGGRVGGAQSKSRHHKSQQDDDSDACWEDRTGYYDEPQPRSNGKKKSRNN
jgi:hypothetical protein